MKRVSGIILILFLVSIVLSCGEKNSPEAAIPQKKESPPAAAPVEEDVETLSPVETPEYRQAMITFISGDVFRMQEGEWVYADIGELLEADDSVKVDPGGYCELQFGDRAVVRIEEGSELKLSRVALEPGQAKVGLELVSGSVLSRVQKLADNERFSVKTRSVVCGVRGTEFSVKTEEGQPTVLAVKEGSVAVLPPQLDVDALVEEAGESGSQVSEILAEIGASAQVVAANEEVSLDEETFEDTRESVEEINEIIKTVAEAEADNGGVSQEQLRSLSAASDKVAAGSGEKTVVKSALSTESRASLNKIEEIRMVSLTPASADSGTGSAQPQASLFKFSLKVIPSDGNISLNGRGVGSGAFSAVFQEGEVLQFNLEREGYAPKMVTFTVSGETARQHSISLEKEKSEPAAAPAGKETSGIEEKEEKEITEAAAEKPVDVSVAIKPSNGEIFVNGEKVASGTYRGTFPEGAILKIDGKRRGFSGESLTVTVSAAEANNYSLNLKARPIESVLPLSGNGLVGSVSSGSGLLFSSDSGGSVFASTPAGKLVWKVLTGNSSVENSFPVYAGNRIYFSGAKELVIMNAADGRIISREPLDKNSTHMFGRHLVAMGNERIFPANNEIRILGGNGGDPVRTISLPGAGSRMTPGVWKNKILSVDQNGLFSIINAASGTVEKSIPTGGVQPIAISVTVWKNFALFSGRKGNVVCINLDTETVEWETQLPGNGVQVYSDIVCGNRGAYLFSKDVIHALALEGGNELFSPISGVTSPPLVFGNNLVFGTVDKRLTFVNAGNGRVERSLKLDETLTTRPAEADGIIVAGTESGKLMVINPEGVL